MLHGGPRHARGRGGFGVFVPHFHNGKCLCIADGEMFPIRIRKFDYISIRQTCRWKARFVGFVVMYSVSTSTSGFMRNLQKRNAYSAKTRMLAASFMPLLRQQRLPRLPPAYRISSNGSRGSDSIFLFQAGASITGNTVFMNGRQWRTAHGSNCVSALLNICQWFRLRMLPLDDTCTLQYGTLADARILQKYSTYATYPRALMAARLLAYVPRCGPVPKLLWTDLSIVCTVFTVIVLF